MFFNRPVPGYADYRTPIRGLYLCGSSSHPGGGVMAAPGANAAREVLRDLGRSEEHTSELQSLMRNSYAVFCLKKKNEKKCMKSQIKHNTTSKKYQAKYRQ